MSVWRKRDGDGVCGGEGVEEGAGEAFGFLRDVIIALYSHNRYGNFYIRYELYFVNNLGFGV